MCGQECIKVHIFEGQWTAYGSQFSPTMWVPGMEIKLLGLVANAFTQ